MATFEQRESGNWQAKIRRDGYPARSQTFATKREAEAWARAEESVMDSGAWRDRSSADSTTLFKLLERYLTDIVPTKRGADIEKVRIKTLQRDSLSKHKLSALSPLVLVDWRDRRLAAGAAGATVNRELNVISAVLNWARKDLMIAMDNPIAAIRRPPAGKARDRRLEPGEDVRLLKALTDHSGEKTREDGKKYRVGTRNPWIKPLARLALETAMRRGEILALEWENVDLQRQTAFLPETKNGESRAVPLSTRAVAILKDLQTGKIQAELGGKVFPVSANAVKLAFARARKRAGLDDFRFHDLRHEATTRLADKLGNVLELAAVTGHKDLRMLKRYYHPRAEDLAKKLD